MVTSYETILMEQGKSKIFPIFQVKNTGQRTYTNVVLAYEAPQAEGGRKASLQLHRPYWDSFTLRAGEEIALNPSSNEGNAYLSASTSQPTVIYSTSYHFEFEDEEGHRYETPPFKIDSFAQVVQNNGTGDVKTYRQPVSDAIKSPQHSDVPLVRKPTVRNLAESDRQNLGLYFGTIGVLLLEPYGSLPKGIVVESIFHRGVTNEERFWELWNEHVEGAQLLVGYWSQNRDGVWSREYTFLSIPELYEFGRNHAVDQYRSTLSSLSEDKHTRSMRIKEHHNVYKQKVMEIAARSRELRTRKTIDSEMAQV